MNGGSLLGSAIEVTGGTCTVSSGTVMIDRFMFTSGSGTLNLNGGSITSGGALTDSFPVLRGDMNINAGATWNVTNPNDGSNPAVGGLRSLANNGSIVLSGSLDTTSFDTTGWINQTISGTGSLTKQGTGGYVINGTSAYTGPTNIEAGKFYVQAQLGNTAVAVSAGAFLGGGSGTTTYVGVTPGTILGSVAVASSGTISPGVFDDGYGGGYFIGPIAALTVGSLSLSNGSHTVLDITGTMPFAAEYDQLVGTGAGGLTYGGSLDLLLTGSYATGTTWNLFSNFLTKNGDFADVNLNATGEYAGLTFTSFGGVWTSTKTANNQYLEFTPSTGDLVVVPEPSTIAMTLAGLACGGWQMVRRRRQLRQAASLSA